MNNTSNEEIRKTITPQEEKEMQDGFALEEMTQTAGWLVLKGWLEDLAFHAWVDPRQTKSREEWEWQELNAFHAANTAKELIGGIEGMVSRARFLLAKKNGDVDTKRMRI